MRVALICLFGGFASVASAQEMPTSLPSSQPINPPSNLPIETIANVISPASEPVVEPTSSFPTVELPRLTPQMLYRSNPGVATALAIVPGAGHFYLGEGAEGLAYLEAEVVFLHFLFTSAKVELPGLVSASLAQNLWFYNIFDAYRDSRVKINDVGYKIPITREPLSALVSAPFRASVLRKPWVWLGVPAALMGGLGVSLLAEEFFPSAKVAPMLLKPTPLLGSRLKATIDRQDAGLLVAGGGIFAATFLPVGIGEESLFRGCFQSGLTQQLGPTQGWLAASLLFGAVHIGNFVEHDPVTFERTGFNEVGYLAVPYITLVGAGLGYMYMKDGYKLETNVAAHFWYDFLLSVGSLFSIANEEPAMLQFSFPL